MVDGALIFRLAELFLTMRLDTFTLQYRRPPHCSPRLPQSVPMTWNRRNRLATALFALVSLLFMQFAVAAYSCPGGLATVVKSAQMTLMAQADMPCAESMTLAMDDEQPNLCRAHCQTDQQGIDKCQVPGFPISAHPATHFPLPRVVSAPLGAPLQAPLLRRTTAPPLAVRNCCFRI